MKPMNMTINSEPRISFAATDINTRFDIPAEKPWTLPRHIPGFRPLAPSERWHRDDFTKDMLPDGWRPLLLEERDEHTDEELNDGEWLKAGDIHDYRWQTNSNDRHCRTRRPLPHTDEWIPWEGKGGCPVHRDQLVTVRFRNGEIPESATQASRWVWGHDGWGNGYEIIAFQLVAPKPEPKPPEYWSKPEHVPKTDKPIWIGASPVTEANSPCAGMLVEVRQKYIGICEHGRTIMFSWDALREKSCVWSTDRRTWKLCVVESEGER